MANLLSTTIRGWIGSKLFASGFMGSGWRINKQNGRYKFEIDDIVVRNTMTVFELIIQKIRAVKGALAITQANGKVKNVDWNRSENYAFLEIEDDMSFVEHDFIRCQSFANNTLHSYWVVVSEIVGNEIKILKSEFAGVIPKEGDELVQFGNESHDPKYAGRHSAIYLHADESGMPAIDVLENIYSKTFEGCLKVRLGGDLPGANNQFGLHCVNGMLKGTDDNGNLQYCIYPNGTAEFGCKSAIFKPDKSGHIAGGAISWFYNKEKDTYECKLDSRVVLSWENLDEETREKLKGEKGDKGDSIKGDDAILYELKASVPSIIIDSSGNPKEEEITVSLYKTIGNNDAVLCTESMLLYTVYFADNSASSGGVGPTIPISTYSEGAGAAEKVTISASVNQKTVCRLTILSVHEGFNADWLQQWEGTKTQIGNTWVVSPQIMAGKKNADGVVTGVVMGTDLKIVSVSGASKKYSGLFCLKNGIPVVLIDANTGNAYFKGRVEADEGYFKGRIEADEGYFKGKIEAEEGLFKGRIESKEGTFGGKVETSINGKKIIVDPENKCIKMLTSEGLETVCIEFEENNSDEANYGFGKFTLKSYPSGVHTYTAVLTPDSIGVSNIIDNKISMLNPYGYSVTSGKKRIYISLQQNQNGSYIADLYSNAWPTKDSVSTGSVYRENDGTLKVK